MSNNKKNNNWFKWLIIAAVIIAVVTILINMFWPSDGPVMPPAKPDRYKQMMEDSVERMQTRINDQLTKNNEDNETIDSLFEALQDNRISDEDVFDLIGSMDASFSDSIWAEQLLQVDSLERGLTDRRSIHPILFTE